MLRSPSRKYGRSPLRPIKVIWVENTQKEAESWINEMKLQVNRLIKDTNCVRSFGGELDLKTFSEGVAE